LNWSFFLVIPESFVFATLATLSHPCALLTFFLLAFLFRSCSFVKLLPSLFRSSFSPFNNFGFLSPHRESGRLVNLLGAGFSLQVPLAGSFFSSFPPRAGCAFGCVRTFFAWLFRARVSPRTISFHASFSQCLFLCGLRPPASFQ